MIKKINKKEAWERIDEIAEIQQEASSERAIEDIGKMKLALKKIGDLIHDLEPVSRKRWAKKVLAEAFRRIGASLYGMGNFYGAISQFRASAVFLKETEEVAELAIVLHDIVMMLRDKEDEEEISLEIQRTITEALGVIKTALGNRRVLREAKTSLLATRNNIAMLLSEMDQAPRAIELLKSNIEFCETIREGKDTAYLETYWYNLGIQEMLIGDLSAAEYSMSQVLEILKATEDGSGMFFPYAVLDYISAVRLQESGDIDNALMMYLHRVDKWELAGRYHEKMAGWTYLRLIECYTEKGYSDEAGKYLCKAWDIAKKYNDKRMYNCATALYRKIEEDTRAVEEKAAVTI